MAEVEEDEIDYEGMNNNLGQALKHHPRDVARLK